MATAAAKRANLSTTTFVVESDFVNIPSWVVDLDSFRRWALSDEFPERGRICFLNGEVWVDMSKEQLFSHNQIKGEFTAVLTVLAKTQRLGRFFPDGALLSNVPANLSTNPDGLFVSTKSLRAGNVRLVEGKHEGYLEMEGTPDMVLEVVSTSSVEKDYETLRDLYWRAGVAEYWLVDARGDRLVFDILRHAAKGYVPARRQGAWLKSSVFRKSFRLTKRHDPLGHPEYALETK